MTVYAQDTNGILAIYCHYLYRIASPFLQSPTNTSPPPAWSHGLIFSASSAGIFFGVKKGRLFERSEFLPFSRSTGVAEKAQPWSFLFGSFSFVSRRKKKNIPLEKTNKLPIFAAHWFATPMRGKQLKGNQVQVLNSPAAVSSIPSYKQFTHCHWRPIREGVCNRNKSEDLPCK